METNEPQSFITEPGTCHWHLQMKVSAAYMTYMATSKTWRENRHRAETVRGGDPNASLNLALLSKSFILGKHKEKKNQWIKKHQHDLKFIFCFHYESSNSVFSLGLQIDAVTTCSTMDVHREAVIIFMHLIIPY